MIKYSCEVKKKGIHRKEIQCSFGGICVDRAHVYETLGDNGLIGLPSPRMVRRISNNYKETI